MSLGEWEWHSLVFLPPAPCNKLPCLICNSASVLLSQSRGRTGTSLQICINDKTVFQSLFRQNYKLPSASCAWYIKICSLSIRTSCLQLNSKPVAYYSVKGELCPSFTELQVTKLLTKTSPISGGSGKQHWSSAAVDAFGYGMRCVNMKFRLLFSAMKLTRISPLWHQKNENELCAGHTEELC